MDKFAQAGIYTLFDMHQDCLWETDTDDLFKGTIHVTWLSKKLRIWIFLINFKGYWGVPPWIKGKLPVGDNFPYPFEAFSGWFCAYFTEEVSNGFQDIYDDVANTRQEMTMYSPN